MKKKRLRLVTTIALLAALAGGSGGVAWGQAYKSGYVTSNGKTESRNPRGVIDDSKWPSVKAQVYFTEDAGYEPAQLRRTHAPGNVDVIQNAMDVGVDEFGAGESSRINGTHDLHINEINVTTGIPSTMHFDAATKTPASGIILGSQNSKNVVIKTYSGGGFAMGWLSVLNAYGSGVSAAPIAMGSINSWADVKNIPSPHYYDAPHAISSGYNIFSFNKYNQNAFRIYPGHTNPWNSYDNPGTFPSYYNPCDGSYHSNENTAATSGTPMAPCTRSLFEMHYHPSGLPDGKGKIWVYHHTTSNVPCLDVEPSDRPTYYYTTSIDNQYTVTWPTQTYNDAAATLIAFPTDDEIPLVQVNGTIMKSAQDMTNQVKMASTVGTEDYQITPGTLYTDITGANWPTANQTAANMANYKRPTTMLIERGASDAVQTFDNFTYRDINWWYTTDTVTAQITGKASSSGCGSGVMTFIAVKPTWGRPPNPVRGNTFIDGAIVVAAGAHVCVKHNVKDATSEAATSKTAGNNLADEKTDAILVLPDDGRSTLRVAGNFDSINMAHNATAAFTAATNNSFFTQATFPVAATDIYSYPAGGDFGNGFQFAPLSLKGFNNGGLINLPDLENKTPASVLGVYGNYNYKANNAEWHTNLVPASATTNHPGVIEIGSTTRGTGHMHIYSGGMLKNFESCTINTSFQMYLGCPVPGMGDTASAQFNLNGSRPLYILNYGVGTPTDPCNADLLFYKAATDSLASAFTNATASSGIMRIQALSDVELRADTKIDATPQSNDFYMLSDGGNVMTQKFDFTSKFNTAPNNRGLLGIWAEDRQNSSTGSFSVCANGGVTDRNSKRGNVYMNDSVKITRPASTDGAETNVRAANNIRTAMFDYTSDNNNNDITNVISRKGDVYLGYSIGSGSRRYDNASGAPGNAGYDFNKTIFRYNVTDPANAGSLNIKAGWDDNTDTGEQMQGGNIYFSALRGNMITGGTYPTNINIPFSNEYLCASTSPNTGLLHERKKDAMRRYEHAGIIGGIGHCGVEQFDGWQHYGGLLQDATSTAIPAAIDSFSLVYYGNKGDLTLDAGKRGNIIMNRGVKLNYNDDNGNAIFRTREGDIDMRDPFDAEKMKGSLLFLAQIENIAKLSDIKVCGCDEERNNVYLQDFEYKAEGNSGSVFVGADNNIKLNYGGLPNIGTRQDPFLSKPVRENGKVYKEGFGYAGATTRGCGTNYHCDLKADENKARDLTLDFKGNGSVTSGGFAAVASDMIDVYKNLIYHGGTGSGLSSVPGTGTLHGEAVAGYGLYMKTQGNKKNWTDNILLQAPKCPTTCAPTGCGEGGRPATAFLHNTVRMTFHSDARFYAENQHVHLESPVIETFGVLELNAEDGAGANAMITIKTDSLICHDSLIRKGKGKVQLTTWSGLPKDQPIIKLGYSRKAAPFYEYAYDDGGTQKICRECVSHYKGKVYPPGETPLDTMFVKFGPDTEWERQNVMVVDHTVISFLTDSFDHVKGGDVRHARYFVDTTKIRNQVEFWTDAKHERDGHLELISEEQMGSKDYAGLYTRHLHLEPIGACGRPTSELWLPGLALDVITTSTFGGFGIQYTDVHVENGANLNPGFTSLRLRGQCYEQACGTLTMKDLRLDGGSELHFSVGTTKGLNGEYSDAIDVDRLTTYGPVNVNIEIRPCEKMQKRCYPIMYYKSVTPNSLNNLKLNPRKVKIDGEEYPLSLNVSTDGIVYVCVGDAVTPGLTHTVTMPETAGVKTTPSKGIWSRPTRSSFSFTATYSGNKPLVVRTNRLVNGQQEVLNGVKNANGEYEYIVPSVQQEVTLTFGPDVVANELLTAGTAVWSHGEKIYIRVERADIASIYSVAGQLVKRVDLPEGDTSIPMSRGAYVITLKDGSVHKVIVK